MKKEVRSRFGSKKGLLTATLVVLVAMLLLGVRCLVGKYSRTNSNESKIDNKGNIEIISDKSLHGELPDNFPNNFPVYDGASIDESWGTRSSDSYGASVVWSVNTSPANVLDFYERELILAGYEVSVSSGDSDSYIISLNKDDESGFVGIVKGDSQETLISVTIGMKDN